MVVVSLDRGSRRFFYQLFDEVSHEGVAFSDRNKVLHDASVVRLEKRQ